MTLTRKQHLFNLARACLAEFELGPNYGMGLQQDEKRPFGNSGLMALIDTLNAAEVERVGNDITEEESDYAHALWQDLPDFISDRCEFVLKGSKR